MAVNSLLTTIPSNAMPTSSAYSGMGNEWQNFSKNNMLPIIQRLTGSFGNFAQPYSDANAASTKYMTGQLMPAMQGALNKLAGRGMINSSVASDALSKVGADLGRQALGVNANMMGNAALNYGNAVMNAAQLGQYSTSSSKDTSAPWRILASILTGSGS